MEENAIYKFLKENNLTTKSEVEFISEYSNREKADELFKFMQDNKLTSKSSDEFYSQYFASKQPEISKKKSEPMVFAGETGSSESPKFEKEGNLFKPGQGITIPEDAKPSVNDFDAKLEKKGKVNPVLSNMNIMAKTVANLPADIGETWSIASSFIERTLGDMGVPGANPELTARDVKAYKLSEDWRKYMEEVYPVNEGDESAYTGQVMAGLGQIIPMVLSGGISAVSKGKVALDIAKNAIQTGSKLTPFIKMGKEIGSQATSISGLVGGSQASSSMYREAIESGATEDQAFNYALENFGVGLVVESLPIQSMFSRLRKIEPGSTILNVLKEGVTGLSEEGLTEMWQTTYENWSAQRIFDANREMLDGVGEAGAVGGTIGFMLNASLAALIGKKRKLKNPDEIELIDQAIAETEDKINTINENNREVSELSEEVGKLNPMKLEYGDMEYNFVGDETGKMELAEDPMTIEQATSMQEFLTKNYDKIDFSIEKIETEDPTKAVQYKIVAKEKATETITPEQEVASPDGTIQEQAISEATVGEESQQAEALADVDNTAKALEGLSNSQMLEIPYISGVDRGDRQGVSEAYHKAKADGSNPELVKAVENLLTQQTEQLAPEIAKSLTEDVIAKIEDSTGIVFPRDENTSANIARAYEKAKADGSNPKLVQAVEASLKPVESAPPVEEKRLTVKEKKARVQEIKDRPAFTGVSLARKWLLSGGKIKTKQSESDKSKKTGKGVREETGMSGREMQQLVGVVDNKNGLSIEKAAEKIYGNLDEEVQARVSEMDIRDGLIEVLTSEDRKSWIENQDRETSQDGGQASQYSQYEYDNLSPEDRAAYDAYYFPIDPDEQYFKDNQEQLAKEYDEFTKSEEYQNYIDEIYGSDRESQGDAKNQSDAGSQKQSADGGAIPVQARESLKEVINVDVKTNEGKNRALDFIDNLLNDLDEAGKSAGMNLALPLVKAIVKSIRRLVVAGINLQDAIKRAAAENNVSESDVMDAINAITSQREQEGKPQIVSEAELPGYNELMADARATIASATDKKSGARSAIDQARKTDTYKNANDTQKEQIVRDIRKEAGIREKSSPSKEKITGKKKKTVTVDEMGALKDQLKLEAKAAREGAKSYKDAIKSIVSSVREMSKKGKITTRQAGVIISRIAKTNMLDSDSVKKTTDYIAKVFDNADLAAKISKAKALNKTAKVNIKKKIGQSPDLYPALKSLLSIDVSMIPIEMIDKYLGILEVVGARKKILSIQDQAKMTDDVNEIFNEIVISPDVKDDVSKKPDDPEVISETIDAISARGLDTSKMGNRDDARVASFISGITKAEIRAMYERYGKGFLSDLNGVMSNIEAGIVTYEANSIKEKVQRLRAENQIKESIKNASKNKLILGSSRLIAAVKSALKAKSSTTLEMIRAASTEFVDDVFGNFNSKTIYNNTFGRLASAKGRLDAALSSMSAKANAADVLLSKGRTNNEAVAAKYRIMAMLLQKEFEVNPNSKSVASALDFINATIEHLEFEEGGSSSYDAQILRAIKDEFTFDGKIDIAKIEATLTDSDKKAVALIKEINTSTADKALFTSAVLRGKRVDMLNEYVHHHVIGGDSSKAAQGLIDNLVTAPGQDRPSTRAGTLNQREPGSKPINFDPIASAYRGAKMTLTDYHMTSDIRVVTGTIRDMVKQLKADKNSTREQIENITALEKSINEALNVTFANSFMDNTTMDKFLDTVKTLGYSQALASIPRAGAEFISNLEYAVIRNPGAVANAKKHVGFAYSSNLLGFLENIGSEQSTRIADNEMLTGKYSEGGVLSSLSSGGKAKATSKIADYANYIKSISIDNATKVAMKISERLISAPDKAISKPYYVSVFTSAFEAEAGVKLTEKDLVEISNGTSKYLGADYSDSMQNARRKADSEIVRMAASSNSFNVILKNAPRKTDSAGMSAYRAANSFMSRFYLTEYGTIRSAVASLTRSGDIDKKTAAAIITASAVRMGSYLVLYKTFMAAFDSVIAEALDLEGEEEDEDLFDMTLRSFVGTGVQVLSRRTLGNVANIPISLAIEEMNKEYGADLRSGADYDPYKNSLVFAQINESDLNTKSPMEIMSKIFAGPYGPLIGSATRGALQVRKAYFDDKAKASTREKAVNELESRTAFEAVGQLGLIPFYKDIRRIMLKDLYFDNKVSKKRKYSKEEIARIKKTNPELAKRLEK